MSLGLTGPPLADSTMLALTSHYTATTANHHRYAARNLAAAVPRATLGRAPPRGGAEPGSAWPGDQRGGRISAEAGSARSPDRRGRLLAGHPDQSRLACASPGSLAPVTHSGASAGGVPVWRQAAHGARETPGPRPEANEPRVSLRKRILVVYPVWLSG